MKSFQYIVASLVLSAAPALASVTVSSPANGATVSSPAHYVATATAPTCAKGVATMGIYVNNVKTVVVKGASLNYELTLPAGKQHTVVEEWDYCKGASTETINVTVTGSGNGSYRQHHRQPRLDLRRWLVHVDRECDQRYGRDGDGNGWQLVYSPAGWGYCSR